MTNLQSLQSYNASLELAKRHYLGFVQHVVPGYQVNWHHRQLAGYLERFAAGEIRRLMVFMPPQHGKSQLVSRTLPAYILGKNPNSKIVLASYSHDLSSGFNRDCQRIIDSDKYRQRFPDTRLNSKEQVKDAGTWLRNSEIFEVVGHTGFLKSVGVGGSLTGTPADFAIIDDPVKDTVEAMSPTYQQRAWNWYNDVLYTRIHNDTGILITQTRWNENDLSGMLLKRMEEGQGDNWTIINLPAIKENDDNPDDPRQVGEALWPDRHNIEKLLHVRGQNLRTFQSLYQQNPQPVKSGGEFYKEFDISLMGSYDYDPSAPLHLTFDFNVIPYMTCNIWQLSGKSARQVGEFCLKSPRNTTKKVCEAVKVRFTGHSSGMFIYGDPSGVKRDTRSEQGANDYSIIMKELAEFKPKLRVAKSAPSVVMRANFINAIFSKEYSVVSLAFDNKCTHTKDDYLFLKEDSDGTKKKERAVEPSTGVSYEKYGHTSDANDYFICEAFAEDYKKFQNRNKSNLSSKISYFK